MTKILVDRLVLRPFAATDADAMYGYLGDPEVLRYEPYPPFDQRQCEHEAVRRVEDGDFWAVCLRRNDPTGPAEGELIGNLWLHRTDPLMARTWELGYVFGKQWWNNGYATEACRGLLDRVFLELGAHRVTASCDPRNTASWALLERLGMRREAHHVRAATFRSDDAGIPFWHDAYVYAALEEEWIAQAQPS